MPLRSSNGEGKAKAKTKVDASTIVAAPMPKPTRISLADLKVSRTAAAHGGDSVIIANLPIPVTPVAPTRLIPMPIFYNNAPLSLLAVMLFPDDLDLARKTVAHFLSGGTLQSTLGAGVQIDNRYMAAILSDLADGEPDLQTGRPASLLGERLRANRQSAVRADQQQRRQRARTCILGAGDQAR